MWDIGEAILTRKFIALQAYLLKKKKREERRKKRKEKAQINNLTSHLNEIEKEQQTKPKVSTRKEIIKIRAKKEKKK